MLLLLHSYFTARQASSSHRLGKDELVAGRDARTLHGLHGRLILGGYPRQSHPPTPDACALQDPGPCPLKEQNLLARRSDAH
ncbi:unnamed protein product [Linum trigynum]|uniref:Uncharacterized protein n=1 Tax=Linum trigynum TaxID=586398 RepID=A0AAV2GUD2_9ROSI